jgi:DNA adenine methylase
VSPRPFKLHPPIDATYEEVLTAIADENMPKIQAETARPFLKWVGGKRSILPELTARMPAKYEKYCEPFLGGGALFFETNPPRAYLSDLNFYLVLTYRAVRDDVERLISQLKAHDARHKNKASRAEYYKKARKRIAHESDPTKIAAWMIYLNKTCYNGLYRVNQSGEFNVPIGSYDEPPILDEENLRSCAKALSGVEIMQHSFLHVPIQKGNFYYLDPPFHKTFSSFDSSGFDEADHEKLAEFCGELNKGECYFMLSNSDTPFIRKLYEGHGYIVEEVKAGRFVSCKGDQRGKETELLIRNYAGTRTERTEGAADGQRP